MDRDPYDYARQLAAESVSANDPTGWFERLYAEAETGAIEVPWGGSPNRFLVGWATRNEVDGRGRSAVVVGCGLGDDAEYVAGLGFDTLAFDVAPSAVRAARRRFAHSRVEYVVADLLSPPARWFQAFDLVVEIFTVQVLPPSIRGKAIDRIADLVAPGGTLLVIARGADAGGGPADPIPWPLTRAEIDSFAAGGCRPVRVETLADPGSSVCRWRAEFHRAPSLTKGESHG